MNTSTVKRYLPWVVAVALFMEGLDTTIVNTAVPAIAEGLQGDQQGTDHGFLRESA